MDIIQEEKDDEPEEELHQVVVAIRNKMLILILDDETIEDFDEWTESVAVYSCEQDPKTSFSDENKTDSEKQKRKDRSPDSADEPSPPSPFEFTDMDAREGAARPCVGQDETKLDLTIEVGDTHIEIIPDTTQELHLPARMVSTRDASCQTVSQKSSTSTTGDTSSDNPGIAIKKEYRCLPTRI